MTNDAHTTFTFSPLSPRLAVSFPPLYSQHARRRYHCCVPDLRRRLRRQGECQSYERSETCSYLQTLLWCESVDSSLKRSPLHLAPTSSFVSSTKLQWLGCCDDSAGGVGGWICHQFCGPCAIGKLMAMKGGEGEGPQAVAEPGNCFCCALCWYPCMCCNRYEYPQPRPLRGKHILPYFFTHSNLTVASPRAHWQGQVPRPAGNRGLPRQRLALHVPLLRLDAILYHLCNAPVDQRLRDQERRQVRRLRHLHPSSGRRPCWHRNDGVKTDQVLRCSPPKCSGAYSWGWVLIYSYSILSSVA